MNKNEGVLFLFNIGKEVRRFYETPVIFVTKRDYGDDVFNTLCKLRNALLEDASNEHIMDIIVDFNLQWLQAVTDIENFKTRVSLVAREEALEAITFTMDAIGKRVKYLQKYIDNLKSSMSPEEARNIQIDMEILEAMNKEVTYVLLEKLTCFRNFTGEAEFQFKLTSSSDELLEWLDKINDGLAIQVTKVLKVDKYQLALDLTDVLKHLVEQLCFSPCPIIIKFIHDLKLRGQQPSSLLRSCAGRELEMSKILEKISCVEDRIKRLEAQNSSAVVGLVNKKEILENKLNFLENMKTTLQEINLGHDTEGQKALDEECLCAFEARIFNHLLPVMEREQLVTELCSVWDKALFGEKKRKSVISILSATDAKEDFTDDLGTFFVDVHGRKIYRLQEDSTFYQQNEQNKLVPVQDDDDHVYFYDECGRYFIDKKTSQRVYKIHSNASEYMLDATGVLFKIKEERDGIIYYYDTYGRYYINDEGKHIYREAGCNSEYEYDGFGNLVRLRSQFDLFELCPDDCQVSEDNKYLKLVVGPALRQSIADVILYQPADPIKYLSTRLKKYRENLELKDRRAKEKEELLRERELRLAEERAAAERAALEGLKDYGASEASYDSNLLHYTSMQPDTSSSTTN